MAKLNIYADEDMIKQAKELNLPLSQICRDAIWEAIEEAGDRSCKRCKAPATFHVIKEDGDNVFTCDEHVGQYIGDQATVRSLVRKAPKRKLARVKAAPG